MIRLDPSRQHISAIQRHRKHPNPRDVPFCWSCHLTHSSLPRKTRGRRTCSPGRFIREFPPRIVVSSALINIISKISWGSCESFGLNSTDPNLQCGYLEVPMDYHDSSAGNARLAVAKYAATASKKLGSIFFNPGSQTHPPSLFLPLIPHFYRRTWRFWSRGS